MKPENKAFLEKEENKRQWQTLKGAGFVGMFGPATCNEFIRIAREEWAPNFWESCTCNACRENIIRYVYTQYEKELAAEPINNQDNVKLDQKREGDQKVPKGNKKAGTGAAAHGGA